MRTIIIKCLRCPQGPLPHPILSSPMQHWFWFTIWASVGGKFQRLPLGFSHYNSHSSQAQESPLDCKEIQPVHPKGDQSWVFIGRTDVEAETPVLWPPDAKSRLIWKDPDAGKDWGQEEKGMTENEMVGWHHRLDGHGFGWTPRVGDGQGSLVWLQFIGSQRVRHNWATKLNWTSQAQNVQWGLHYLLQSMNLNYRFRTWRNCNLGCK